MLIALCTLFLVLILPLRLSAFVQKTTSIQGSLGVQTGFIRLTFPFRVARTPQGGHQLTFLPRSRHVQPHPASADKLRKGATALKAFLRADKARTFLLRHTQLDELTLALRLSAADAATTARLTGLVRSVNVFVPSTLRKRIRIMVQPDFFTFRTTGSVRCIVSLRLGILLITGSMLLAAWLRQRQESSLASKEENSYGTSHR